MPPTPPESPLDDLLDIKLSQSPYEYYTPGSKVTGWVVFGGRVEVSIIDIQFTGVNKSRIVDKRDRWTGQLETYVDEAVLFQYQQILHGIGERHSDRYRPIDNDWNVRSSWNFTFRFPSNTESRRTVAYNVVTDGGWTNSRHVLPPSFDKSTDADDLTFYASSPGYGFGAEPYSECKVEYSLTASVKMPGRSPKMVKLPIQFMPFAPASGWPLRSLGMSYSQFASLSGRDIEAELVHGCGPFDRLSVHIPSDIKIGHRFTVDGNLTFSNSPRRLFALSTLEPRFQIRINYLQVVCKTVWRGVRRTRTSYGIGAVERRHEEQQVSSLVNTEPRCSSQQPAHALGFSFEAGARSQLSPSFGSFLISNTYDLKGEIQTSADGQHQVFSFEARNIPVVSSVQASMAGIRQLHYTSERRHSSQI
jgi:hypothetical protein